MIALGGIGYASFRFNQFATVFFYKISPLLFIHHAIQQSNTLQSGLKPPPV